MIIKNAELWFPRLNPERPNGKYNKDNPTWELQIRTYDKAQMKEWKEANLNVHAVLPEEDDAKPYWRVNLRKKSKKSDLETPNGPVKVVDGNLDDVDPDTIGNGSMGHIRLFQYEYGEEKKIASVLMGVQLTKHILFKRKEEEGFEKGDTEIVAADPEDMADSDDDIPFEKEDSEPKKKAPSPSINGHSDDDF